MGVGSRTNITAVALASLLPIVIYTYHGIGGVPADPAVERALDGHAGAGAVRKILLPAATDSILTGVRIALGFAFVLTVSSEMIASTAGMGNLMFMYGENGAYSYMYAAVGAVVIVAFLADRLLVSATGWLLRLARPGAARRRVMKAVRIAGSLYPLLLVAILWEAVARRRVDPSRFPARVVRCAGAGLGSAALRRTAGEPVHQSLSRRRGPGRGTRAGRGDRIAGRPGCGSSPGYATRSWRWVSPLRDRIHHPW